MAYDPKDPADKKIVDDLIAAAIAEAETEHEAAVTGLKNKNKELLEKIKKGSSDTGDAAEVARLEGEVSALTTRASTAEKAVKTLTKERDDSRTSLEAESKVAHKLLVDNGLTEALVANKVAPQFMPAVKAMLAGQVVLKADGENRTAMVGDKPLGEFVKAWSQGDEGKHYVSAPVNNGGGANGGKVGQGDAKTMTRAAYDEMSTSNPEGTAKFFSEGGKLTD